MVVDVQPLARCFFAKQLSTGRPSAFQLAKIEGRCLAKAADEAYREEQASRQDRQEVEKSEETAQPATDPVQAVRLANVAGLCLAHAAD